MSNYNIRVLIRVNKERCYRYKQQTKTDSLGEEKFHSAPESPLSSDETTSPVATTPPTEAVGRVTLPEPVTKRGYQSKRKKKQRTKVRKIAREEFFRPICELFEDEYNVLGVSVLSLTQGWWKWSGCSGFGRTSFSQGKSEMQFLQKASNKQ